jgi:hypothetical protein
MQAEDNPNERISSADVVSKINNFNLCDKKKPYAAFLINQPINNKPQPGRDNLKVALMNRIGSAFLIDCSGEYEDCDNEEKKKFQEAKLLDKKLLKIFKKIQNN